MEPGVPNDAAVLLRKYLRNIVKHPQDPKYRRIRLANDAFAVIWGSVAVQDLLTSAGWVVDATDSGFITLPLAVEPDAMQLLLDAAAPVGPAAGAAAQPLKVSTISVPVRAKRISTGQTEAERKKATISKERAEVANTLRRMKDEKARIKKQLDDDRREAQGRQMRASKRTGPPPGANIQRFADVGVDLNKGGG
jgi:hypothetical protein